MAQPAARPLVVFADDWGRHPSSCQHLVRHLLSRREVVWVNTIGTRPPRLDWGTAKRVAGKLAGWINLPPFRGDAESPEGAAGPRVVAPKMWPSFRSRFGRVLNRRLLVRSLRPVFESFSRPPTVVTTLPLVADLVGRLPAHRWVYYCVDDFGVWPGYDGETMARLERELVPKADTVVAVSDTLVSHVGALGKPAHLLTHGVDLDHWTRPAAPPAELDALPRPLVVFWGVIDRRMDLDFVRALAARPEVGTLAVVGPREDPDPALDRVAKLKVLPPMAYAKLPGVADAAAVLVMPYADLPVTRAMQPLKLKEYLATGKPVVVRGLPSTRTWADACDVCDTAEAFAAAVAERLRTGLPDAQRLVRQWLAGESWSAKAARFEQWIDG